MADDYLKKWFCGPYDWELYFRISNHIVPIVLKDALRQGFVFYIYGGKAVDAHMNKLDTIGSPDWDIKCERFNELAEFIRDGIIKQLPKIELSTDGVSLGDTRGIQIGIITNNDRCKKLYFVDVFYKQQTNTQAIKYIDGLPYITRADLVDDLRQTVVDRTEAFRLAILNLEDKRIEFLERKKKEIDEIQNTINTSIDEIVSTLEKSNPRLKNLKVIRRKVDDLKDFSIEYGRIKSRPDSLQVQYQEAEIDMMKNKLDRTKKRLSMLEHFYTSREIEEEGEEE